MSTRSRRKFTPEFKAEAVEMVQAAGGNIALVAKELNRIREIDPTMILSSHLPAAPGNMIERLLGSLEAAPAAQPFLGPDQATLEQMLVPMTAGGDLQ